MLRVRDGSSSCPRLQVTFILEGLNRLHRRYSVKHSCFRFLVGRPLACRNYLACFGVTEQAHGTVHSKVEMIR